MNTWQYLLLTGLAAAVLLLAACNGVRKGRIRKERDFIRRLETLLLPKETIKLIHDRRKGRWIVTSHRLILETGEGFTAIPFARIKKVSGTASDGKATVAAARMEVLTVRVDDREFTLRRKGDAFTDLVKALKAGVSAAKKKSK